MQNRGDIPPFAWYTVNSSPRQKSSSPTGGGKCICTAGRSSRAPLVKPANAPPRQATFAAGAGRRSPRQRRPTPARPQVVEEFVANSPLRARSCADLLVPEYRRTMNARTEKRADEESKKFDEKQNDLPSKLAEGITTELRSYPKRIITQFQLKL